MKTYNFIEDKDVVSLHEKEQAYRDARNGIVCISPSFDFECYINYIELLNMHRDQWTNNGYLDMGMMPLVMAPSFMHEYLVEKMCELADVYEIPVYSMPPVSVMLQKCNIGMNDIWVFKADVARVMKCDQLEVNLVKFLRWCGF